MKIELAKGVRDYPPQEQILRQEMIGRIRTVFERYGYSPLETPIIERLDTLTAKFGAGEGTDVMKEIFRLTDQGGRELGLKFDMTVPLARFIAQNPTVKLPFKRYAIDRAFRDGPIKLGRDREFYQCDADIVGCRKMTAEAELISLTLDVFKELSLDVHLEVNNRRLMYAIMDSLGIKKKDETAIIIDKLKKISGKEILAELERIGIPEEKAEELLEVMSIEGKPSDVFLRLEKLGMKGLDGQEELKEIFSYVKSPYVKISLSLARGLSYYTGTIMEAFLKDSKVTCSVAGGGRYDDMVGKYVGRGDYPAIGISFGLVPIIEAIKLSGFEERKTVTEVLVIPIGQMEEALQLAGRLRESGLNTETDLLEKGVSKSLNYANHYGIPFTIFVGEEEVKAKRFKLKDMKSGTESSLTEKDIVKAIRARIPR